MAEILEATRSWEWGLTAFLMYCSLLWAELKYETELDNGVQIKATMYHTNVGEALLFQRVGKDLTTNAVDKWSKTIDLNRRRWSGEGGQYDGESERVGIVERA